MISFLKQSLTESEINFKRLFVIAALAIFAWFCIEPQQGLSQQAFHMIIIFVATMAGIMLEVTKPIAFLLFTMMIANLTNTIDVKQSFSGMSNVVPWLLFLILSLSKVITKTTIGLRIAYMFLRYFGHGITGLSYSIILTEFIISPMLPSNTARGASVGLPLVTSLSEYITTHVAGTCQRSIGAYLSLLYSSANAVCSALFFTAMISNAIIMEALQNVGINATWISWFSFGIIPCGIILIILPFILQVFCNPGIKNLENLRTQAAKNSKELGPLTNKEKIVIGVFIGMLLMWIFADKIGVQVTVTTILGLCIFITLGIVNVKEMLSCDTTFRSVLMLGLLISYVNSLVSLGAVDWFTNFISGAVQGFSSSALFILLSTIYFFAHYFFSGENSRIIALYVPFLSTGIALGLNPIAYGMTLAAFSSLSDVLTNYSGPVAITMYSSGYVSAKKWLTCGIVHAIAILTIWYAYVCFFN
ncbi:MAG: DASS family sodium-coupled anion symporter [Alphaproteobacteria bacterium]|nr:DASS family sodium-coupled anion symporter [Alphaproteobacteria bacterium]